MPAIEWFFKEQVGKLSLHGYDFWIRAIKGLKASFGFEV